MSWRLVAKRYRMWWTDVARHKNTNRMAPNCIHTLKTRWNNCEMRSKRSHMWRPLVKYFGTKGKMAVIFQQNFKKIETNVFYVQVLMITCLKTMPIKEINVFNEVRTCRPLKKCWKHKYNMGDNRGILRNQFEGRVKLSRNPFKLWFWSLDPTDCGLTRPDCTTRQM